MLTCVVGVNPDQCVRDSTDILQQQTGDLVDSSHSQLSRTEIDREKHSDEILSITEEGRVEQEVKEKSERVQPKAYHIDRSPVGLLKESYESLTGQKLQQIGHGIAEDISIFNTKKERDKMCATCGNETEKAAFAFYTCKHRGYM